MSMYKMVVEITKETWEKFCIKTLIYHNKKEKINELWHKMIEIEIQLGHSNIADPVLKRIRKYYGKKQKTLQKKKNKNTKHILKVKRVFLLLKKFKRDIIEGCKLSEAITLRKILGYNHNDIMFREETSIAEKIIKRFPNENIVLSKKI